MQISNQAIELIKRHEGLLLTAYKCPAGVWTIGYGHTHQVKKHDQITDNMAIEYLKKDLRHAQACIEKNVKAELKQNQYDALVSFIFNIGTGNFKKSTLLKMLNMSNYNGASQQFRRWNKARINGVLIPLRGLTRRRNDEAELFAFEAEASAQQVEIPNQKNLLNSKTNAISIIGIGGLVATQAETAQKLIKQVSEISSSGGDIADNIGGLMSGFSWPMAVSIGIICIFIYVILERKRKIDAHGI